RKDLTQMPVENVTTMVASHVCKRNVKDSFISAVCSKHQQHHLRMELCKFVQFTMVDMSSKHPMCQKLGCWTCVAAPLFLDRTDLKLKVDIRHLILTGDFVLETVTKVLP
ncbi:hypothetical protein Tco_0025894, partial [Tanacetum coccineum]